MIYRETIDPRDECSVRYGSDMRGHIGSRMTKFEAVMFMEHLLQVDFPDDSLHVVADIQDGSSIEVDAYEGDEYVMSYFYVRSRTCDKKYVSFSDMPLLRQHVHPEAPLSDQERERASRRERVLEIFLKTRTTPDVYRDPVFYHRWSMKEVEAPFLDSETEAKK